MFAGSNHPDKPFVKVLHLKQFSPNPPFTQQGDVKPLLSHTFQHLLNFAHSCCHNSMFHHCCPHPCSVFFFFFALKFLISKFFFFLASLVVQPPSLKMAHTAQGTCWESTQRHHLGILEQGSARLPKGQEFHSQQIKKPNPGAPVSRKR